MESKYGQTYAHISVSRAPVDQQIDLDQAYEINKGNQPYRAIPHPIFI